MLHFVSYLIVLAIGFGLGRIKNFKAAEAKFAADVDAAKAKAKSI